MGEDCEVVGKGEGRVGRSDVNSSQAHLPGCY